MKLKRWIKNSKKMYKLQREGIELLDYKKNNPAIQIPFVDMLFDKEKRQTIYKKYDKNYKSTKEEDEIFDEMRIMQSYLLKIF